MKLPRDVLADLERKGLVEEVLPPMACRRCGRQCPRRNKSQRYCQECSAIADLERKRLWARKHPLPKEVAVGRARANLQRARAKGAALSTALASTLSWLGGREDPDLGWLVRIAFPFSYDLSKNHVWRTVARGHVVLRREAKVVREALTARLTAAVERGGFKPVQNKVWLDLLVQKPDHKGDAVNVLDAVCDAAKAALGVDDRWFCVRRLDWEIVKENPLLFVGLGQECDWDGQVCSCCGRILPLAAFYARKDGTFQRYCRECCHVDK